MVFGLHKVRDIIFILAGIIIILYFILRILPIFGGVLPGQSQQNIPSPEEAVVERDFRFYSLSEECVKSIIGPTRFTEIKTGQDSLTIDEREQLASCLVLDELEISETPEGVRPDVDYGVKLVALKCGLGFMTLRFENLPKTGTVDTDQARFKLDGWDVECEGLPESIAPGQIVGCTLTDFVSEGEHWLDYGFLPGRSGGLSMECPFDSEGG